MHSLLKRQLKRFFGAVEDIPEEWQGFISAIDQAYQQFDDDREMLERSMELSSQELLQANSEIRAFFTALPDIFIRLDSEGRISFFKAENSRDVVRPLSELLGKRIQDTPDKIVGQKFQDAIDEVKRTGEMVTIEYRLRLNKREQTYEARLLSLPMGQIVAIIRNMTDIKKAEQALLALDRTKNEFISTAAHELSTPLSTILGYTELLRSPENFGDFDDRQKAEFLREIYEKGEALSRIVDDLLDISRIESGMVITLNMEQHSPCPVLMNVVHTFQRFNDRHHFRFNCCDRQDSSLTLAIDQRRIGQVLENLLSNAVKYSPEGRDIYIEGRFSADDFQVTVADQGIGMTAEQVAHIFDKFYRADASNTAAEGLGLGMSIVKQLVELHGGRIWVESEPGVGTTVYFTLPRQTSL